MTESSLHKFVERKNDSIKPTQHQTTSFASSRPSQPQNSKVKCVISHINSWRALGWEKRCIAPQKEAKTYLIDLDNDINMQKFVVDDT